MTIKVRVFGYLAKRCERSYAREHAIQVPAAFTLEDLLSHAGIRKDEEVIFFVNHRIHTDHHTLLQENDTVWIYPLMGDG